MDNFKDLMDAHFNVTRVLWEGSIKDVTPSLQKQMWEDYMELTRSIVNQFLPPQAAKAPVDNYADAPYPYPDYPTKDEVSIPHIKAPSSDSIF
jgi:hypothetical protein